MKNPKKHTSKNFRTSTALFVLAGLFPLAHAAENGVSYVNADVPLAAIKDINRQSEAWAMCAAAYDLAAFVHREAKPARSEQLGQLANGAELAATMSVFMDGIEDDISPDRVTALWTMAKLAGTERPKAARTMLAAELESTTERERSQVISNISATVTVCVDNLPSQQMYIGAWRELAKSGLLTLPGE